jgi:glycosyltransferase involved in cell wall biosynthesis
MVAPMTKPAVTVLIDTYNHERFIERALVSVLEQDFAASDMEVLVVDDGSTDRTPEIVRKFAPRARLLQKNNGGQASAFNLGIPQAQGDIVAFLDGDDWWGRDKLTKVSEAMNEDASLGIVGHGIIVYRDGEEQSETLREGFRFQANTMEGAKLFRRRCAFLGTSRMTIRADLLRRIGPVPEAIEVQADEYLFTLAAVLAGARILPETLTYYRLHEDNNFQMSGNDSQKLRRKQQSLATLARCLSQKMDEFGIDTKVRRAVIDYTRASANQLRLILDGGWPWETAGTEWTLYRILHPDAAFSHRLFKMGVLLGALVSTPRVFYGVQRGIAGSGFYQRTRERWLPIPQMQHIQKRGRGRP